MDALIISFFKRPYVFAFLVAYLILACRLWGGARTIIWLISGYTIAWASELSSIHNNFPYGEYHYIYENMPGELMNAGVPFFDSLSYPFLIFAGYTTAKFFKLPPLFFGALFTMLIDVIIDPLATMGDKWFLGQIHYYAHPGIYFGVPLTNFAGWFLVAFAVIGVNELVWSFLRGRAQHAAPLPERTLNWLYPAFYLGIALFNIAISFWIGEWELGLASSGILTSIFILSRGLPGLSQHKPLPRS
ncbi:MAG: carotenoid biosynthesis protein [Deltaproteobacteria bacterium]|nr:carotenoid biosynthesis protein [Deltaproteobacteria bacterium]